MLRCFWNMALPVRTATGLLAQIVLTKASTAASSSSVGTARLMRPSPTASCALMNSPVMSISKDFLAPTLRDRATAGVEQNRPTLMPERSEEHTSELQSREKLVCRLLLEKKK